MWSPRIAVMIAERLKRAAEGMIGTAEFFIAAHFDNLGDCG
jgi:hypothetical protein